jgi:membrane-bound metal-dependent hydrolase YbcI (DUF457 family)
MMGRSHVLTGAAGWLAVAPQVAQAAGRSLGPGALALGAGVCAGAALLPDLDHEDGTLAHALGPATHLLTRLVAWASGGHRHATHSLAFAAAAGAGTWALAGHASRWATLGLTLALLAAGLRALDINATAGWPRCWLAAAALTAIAWWRMPPAWPFIPWSVALGCLAHLAGDWLTPEGVALLWPWGVRFELPVIDIHTDRFTERRIIAPLLLVAIGVLTWVRCF